METLLMGAALGINLIVIMYKLRKGRILDGTIDGAVLVSLGLLMSGTITGLMIATIGSSVVSLYLLASPPKFELSDSTMDMIMEED